MYIYVFDFIELCNNIKSIKTISEIDIEQLQEFCLLQKGE